MSPRENQPASGRNAREPNGEMGDQRTKDQAYRADPPGWQGQLLGQLTTSTPLVKLLTVVLLFYSLFNYASSVLFRPMLYIGTDFPSLYTAADVVREGGNLYDMAVFKQASSELGFETPAKPYVYHPLFAYLLIPLTFFDPKIANALFALSNALLLFAIVWFSTPRDYPLRLLILALGLILAANFGPLHDSARLGRVDLYVAVLITMALYFLMDSRPWLGGVLAGMATMLKTTPGLLLVYFLWKRQWRALAAGGVLCAVVIGLGFVVASPETNLVFWKGITAGSVVPSFRTDDPVVAEIMNRSFEGSKTLVEFMDLLPGNSWNLSFLGLAHRLFESESTRVLVTGPTLARSLGIGTSLLLLLSLFWFTRKPIAGKSGANQLELEYGLAVAALVLVSPIVWRFHMTSLLLPLLILARRTLEIPFDKHHWKPWLVFALCYAGLAVSYGWVAGLESGIGLLVMSTGIYVGLILYGLLAWWLARERKRCDHALSLKM